MDLENFIDKEVHDNFWERDLNCSTNILMLLSQLNGIKLDKQVLYSVSGLHGVNPTISQCGLLTGSLMFLGIYAREKNIPNSQITKYYYDFSKYFQRKFGDTLCQSLNNEKENLGISPFSCEKLTKDVVTFTSSFIHKNIKI